VCALDSQKMRRTAGTELANDATVTSHDVTMTSLEPFQQQQQVAVDVHGNNVDRVMSGISDNKKDTNGT